MNFDYQDRKFRKTVEWKKSSKNWKQKRDIVINFLGEVLMNDEENILELGCGEVPIFKDSGKIDIADVSGIDFTQDLNNPIQLVDKFKVIIALELIGHLWNVDGFLKEVKRLLEEDGLFFISSLSVKYWKTRLQLLFGNDKRFDENGYYHWYFSPNSLRKKLEEHGFEIIETHNIGRAPIQFCERFMFVARLK